MFRSRISPYHRHRGIMANEFQMSEPTNLGSLFARYRRHVLRLVLDKDLPELETWKGTARLVGLWLILTIGFALTPFYVLLRLPFLRGGYRFFLMWLGILALVAFVVLLMIFAAGMAGLGSIR